MKTEDIAKICHEVNRLYCKTINDHSHFHWETAPEWQKQSAINGVEFILSTPGAAPSMSHDNWMGEKEAAGWKYGPVKDAEKKEHPCMVPYDELPVEQRRKDHLFAAVVRALTEEPK